jgi:Holliday junction resolvasome RuvABC ATP-dependent DNA helicase subunit
MGHAIRTFNDFVGQGRVVRHLSRLIAGAKQLGRPCPSLLLIAPAGHGKTSLAGAVAQEYGTELHLLFAGEDVRVADLSGHLLSLKHADVVFIDEAHSLSPDAQQALHTALDEEKVLRPEGKHLDRTQLVSIAAFTLIVATNYPGRIRTALRNRLTPISLDPYSLPELKAIAKRMARKEGITLTPQAARLLAEMAQGSPRIIGRLVEALRLMDPEGHKFTQDQIRELLGSEGVDQQGLWPHQRYYLGTLAASPSGASTLERLAVTLGCDGTYIRQAVEPFLLDRGLVEIRSGYRRQITHKGREAYAAGLTEPMDPRASDEREP